MKIIEEEMRTWATFQAQSDCNQWWIDLAVPCEW